MAGKIVVAEHDYDGQDENQLTFSTGDRIIVTEEDDSGWWIGRLEKNGQEGYFPETFVQEINANTTTNNNNAGNNTQTKPPPVPNNNTKNTNIQMPKNSFKGGSMPYHGAQSTDPNQENYYSQGVINLKFNPNAKTRFGMASHYMSYCSSLSSIFLGISAIEWSSGSDYLKANREWCLYSGIYCFLIGIIMWIVESLYGETRSRKALPFRGIGYVLIGTIPCITLVTALCGGQWLVTGAFDILAWAKGEEYSKRENRNKENEPSKLDKMLKYVKPTYYTDKIASWFKDLRQQSKVRKYLFVFVFIAFNIGYIIERAIYYSGIVTVLNTAARESNDVEGLYTAAELQLLLDRNDNNYVLTGWYPIAKMFGNLLDINCAFILFPVCRSFIRYLYNISTDQRAAARCCNTILSFMPLDKAIQWHKLMAFLIVFGTLMHTWAHYMHYGQVPATYEYVFGPTVWISGVIIILSMQFIYCTSFMAVRHGKFELFWYTHHLFVIFFISILFHGAGSINPNFWKWFIVPGAMYLLERTMREIRSRQPVGVVSVTHLNNKAAKVLCLELEKTGPIQNHQEGQYIFIKAPIITNFQWHPFTISSPPDQKTLTVHIRNMGKGTWTDRLQEFFQAMSPMKAYYEAYHRVGTELKPQTTGPDGNNLICVDGPMAAPTQHLGEYDTAIIVGAGIGVTPVRATLQSIVYYRFKKGIGHSYPDHAYCVWIVNYQQLDAYRFMVRTLKEAEDELYDMRKKNPQQMKDKLIQMHIFVTRVPKGNDLKYDETEVHTKQGDRDADLAMWGPHYDDLTHEESNVAQEKAPFSEVDIWRVLKQPKSQPTQIGDIIIHNGRPKWPEFFGPIQQQHQGTRIGCMFCGPDIIARDLKKNAGEFTDFSTNTVFLMHKENF